LAKIASKFLKPTHEVSVRFVRFQLRNAIWLPEIIG
jgi:hypothetical protein